MASIKIKTNLALVFQNLQRKMNKLRDREYLLRPVAIELIPLITERIHKEGKDSGGNQIGTYSNGYMQLRTGNYRNSGKVSRGKNKDKLKDSGTISRGPNKGQPRPNYHRSSDTKIIVSLTRQLENDWSVLATDKGYGIGFNNQFNADKLRWVEEMKGVKIGALTEGEKSYAIDRINELVNEAINSVD